MARVDTIWKNSGRPPFWNDELEAWANERGVGGRDVEIEILTTRMNLIHRDNIYYQYEQGFIDDAFMERIKESFSTRLRNATDLNLAIFAFYGRNLADGPLINQIIQQMDR